MTSIRVAERSGTSGISIKRTETNGTGALPGQVTGGYIDWDAGLCRPIIPNPTKTQGGMLATTNSGNNSTNNLVKPADVTNYVEAVLETRADLSAEERLAFMALTGNEILEVLRNFDISNNSLNLNKNVVDSAAVVNAFNPLQIIKMPNSNTEYKNDLPKTTENTQANISQTTGTTTVSGPATQVSSNSSTSNTTANSSSNTNKVQVEVNSPTKQVAQNTTPTFRLISFTPTSAKKGARITVTHERCNVSSRTLTLGGVNCTISSMTSTTFKFTVPNSVSLVVGQQYELSITIGGVTQKAPGTLTILA